MKKPFIVMSSVLAVLCLAWMVCTENGWGDGSKAEKHQKEMATYWKGLYTDSCKAYPNPNCGKDFDGRPHLYLEKANCYFERWVLEPGTNFDELPSPTYGCYFPGVNDKITARSISDAMLDFNVVEANLDDLKKSSDKNTAALLGWHEAERQRLQPFMETCKSLKADKGKKWLPSVCFPHLGGSQNIYRD
jgi:hypothetical protein